MLAASHSDTRPRASASVAAGAALVGLFLAAAACGHDWSSAGGSDDGGATPDDGAGGPDAEAGDSDVDATEGDGGDGGAATCLTRLDCAGEGPCVDGFCCDRACDGNCQACDLGGAEGRCSPVPARADPDNECSTESAATCGQDGACDGLGGCRRYGAETSCDDGLACSIGDSCDGAGACIGATPSCGPGADNECCAGRCDETAGGCITEATACADACGASVLETERTCRGCGAAHASGTCGGGTVHACDADSDAPCVTVMCGGVPWTCSNAGGTWEWRTDPTCDDGIDCTTGDVCTDRGTCEGLAETGTLLLESPGTFPFTVPCYHELTVVVRGGGGGGGSSYYSRSGDGSAGGDSTFVSVLAGGGGAGLGSRGGVGCTGGRDGDGGTASGGSTNIDGAAGSAGNGGAGGGPGGGAGGSLASGTDGEPGAAPGGGGAGGYNINCGGGGGGGAYSTLTYAPGELAVGSDVAVTVGDGGAGGVGGASAARGGPGGPGWVTIDWY